jgi:hypothetical protein
MFYESMRLTPSPRSFQEDVTSTSHKRCRGAHARLALRQRDPTLPREYSFLSSFVFVSGMPPLKTKPRDPIEWAKQQREFVARTKDAKDAALAAAAAAMEAAAPAPPVVPQQRPSSAPVATPRGGGGGRSKATCVNQVQRVNTRDGTLPPSPSPFPFSSSAETALALRTEH